MRVMAESRKVTEPAAAFGVTLKATGPKNVGKDRMGCPRKRNLKLIL